jgi:predicted AAA+ superfamily ATPase
MKLYRRENYLKKIRGFYHDTGIIKVITGVRSCGKSCLMQTIVEELEESGTPAENIICLNLDRRGYLGIKKPEQLDRLIEEKSAAAGIKYLFIDEIQNVRGFEAVINGFREEDDYSIFIAGSSSCLLNGELVTKLTGRYLEFELFTLSFEEYLGMKRFLGKEVLPDLTAEFDQYISYGGFPKTLEYDSDADKSSYVNGVIGEIFEKNIRRRLKIRNKSVFETVLRYVINNCGAAMSLTGILDDLHKNGCRIKRETLSRYIRILEDAKIIYPCSRFDLRSRRQISVEQKYYLADLGFYFAFKTDRGKNYAQALENVVYIYAVSKGYAVSFGRIGKLECDFVFRMNKGSYAYAQVCATIMNDTSTEDREYRPLEMIRDSYPKYLLTRNDLIQERSGILHCNIPIFLKENRMF